MNKYIEDKPARSRLAEILGVEDDDEWRVTGNDSATYRVHGWHLEYSMSRPGKPKTWVQSDICHLENFIANPDRIIRKPRFSEDEMAMLRCFATAGVKFIERMNAGNLAFDADTYGGKIDIKVLPGILKGQFINLSEVLASCSTK